MCATAIKKDPQYAPGFPNILVFVNHSDSLDLHLRSAVNEFGGAVRNAGASSPLRKLSVFFAAVSRIMLPPQVVSLTPMLGTDGNGNDAVFFRIVLADNSAPRNQLLAFTRQISASIIAQLNPNEEWGVWPYFDFITQSEEARNKQPILA